MTVMGGGRSLLAPSQQLSLNLPISGLPASPLQRGEEAVCGQTACLPSFTFAPVCLMIGDEIDTSWPSRPCCHSLLFPGLLFILPFPLCCEKVLLWVGRTVCSAHHFPSHLLFENWWWDFWTCRGQSLYVPWLFAQAVACGGRPCS